MSQPNPIQLHPTPPHTRQSPPHTHKGASEELTLGKTDWQVKSLQHPEAFPSVFWGRPHQIGDPLTWGVSTWWLASETCLHPQPRLSALDQESEGNWSEVRRLQGEQLLVTTWVLPGSHTPSAKSTAALEHARAALWKSYEDFTSMSWGKSEETTLRLLCFLPSSKPNVSYFSNMSLWLLLLGFHWVWQVRGPWLVCHPRPGWQSSPSSLTGAGLAPPAGTEVWACWPSSQVSTIGCCPSTQLF